MNTHTLKLIDGNFSSEEARSLLVELLIHKINFHKIERFSKQIRFNEDPAPSDKRIDELIRDKNKVIELLNALDPETVISIKADVQLEINTYAI